MNNFLNFEEVLELVKENDEKVFKSEKYDLYFTFSSLVDELDKRCQYGSDYDLVDDVYKEMVEDIFKVDWNYTDFEDFTCDLTKEEVDKWLDEHWYYFNFTEVKMEDIEVKEK